jgi:hypothetical protein
MVLPQIGDAEAYLVILVRMRQASSAASPCIAIVVDKIGKFDI